MDNFEPSTMLMWAAVDPGSAVRTLEDPQALAYVGDWLRGNGNPDGALLAYRRALEYLSAVDHTGQWAHMHCSIAAAVLQRTGADRSATVEEAIAVCEDALAQLAPDVLADVIYLGRHRVSMSAAAPPQGRAELFHQLGVCYKLRLAGNLRDNDEIAFRAFLQALTDTPRRAEPLNWAVEAAMLASALTTRHGGDHQDNIRQAVTYLEDALGIFHHAGDLRRWQSVAVNLAAALFLVEGEDRPRSLQRVIALMHELLRTRERTLDPVGWASATLTLANAYADPLAGVDGLRRAVELYAEVLTEPALRQQPQLHAEALNNLGVAYERLASEDPGTNLKKAADAFEGALAIQVPGLHPRHRSSSLRRLADLYFRQGRWAEAEPLFAEAIDVESRLFEAEVYGGGHRARLPSDIHPRHAYCLVRRGHHDEALVQLEAGKTRLLALALALTAAQLEGVDPEVRAGIVHEHGSIRDLESRRKAEQTRDRFTTRLDDTSFAAGLAGGRQELTRLLTDARSQRPDLRLGALSAAEILALAPEDGALVAPVFTSQGSAVIIVPHSTTSISARHVLLLDDFTTTDLSSIITGISAGTAEAVQSAGEVLWERLVGTIAERLLKLKVRRVLLLPQGGLGLLPVHAAWRMVDGEHRHFADDFEVTYAPSAYALDTARKKPLPDRQRPAVVAGVTRSARFGDLPSIEHEVRSVAEALGTDPLLGAQATAGKILALAGGAEYLHLACHGNFGWDTDPLKSALYLANDEPLTLADVIGRLDLAATRLVSLSACESGVIEASESPDEFFGLTAGFMQVGATGVLSSLWKVDDLSTSLLAADFYLRHLHESMPPATALAAAQKWLRGLTREDVSRHLKVAGRMEESRGLLLLGRKDETPYAHPYYWAPFTYNGA